MEEIVDAVAARETAAPIGACRAHGVSYPRCTYLPATLVNPSSTTVIDLAGSLAAGMSARIRLFGRSGRAPRLSFGKFTNARGGPSRNSLPGSTSASYPFVGSDLCPYQRYLPSGLQPTQSPPPVVTWYLPPSKGNDCT